MATFNAPLPPNRATGDAPSGGPAGDTNLLAAAANEIRAAIGAVETTAATASSTATSAATAVAGKYTKPAGGIPVSDLASAAVAYWATPAQVDARVQQVVGAAPAALDTLVEIAAQLTNDESAATALAGRVTTVEQAAASNSTAIAGLPAQYVATLAIAATLSASATAAVNTHVPVDASAAAVTVTLPAPTRVGQQVRVEKVDSSANVVTVTGTLRGAASSVPMSFQYEVRTFIAESLSSWRVASGNTPKSALDAAYQQVLVYSGGAYPPRPSTAPAGLVKYIGPVQPTTWLANDEWINNA